MQKTCFLWRGIFLQDSTGPPAPTHVVSAGQTVHKAHGLNGEMVRCRNRCWCSRWSNKWIKNIGWFWYQVHFLNPTKKPWKNGGLGRDFLLLGLVLAYFQRDFLATGAKGDVENSWKTSRKCQVFVGFDKHPLSCSKGMLFLWANYVLIQGIAL